ncbi:MAG: transposase [Lautropia sp.]|nr:transposase [Lautropia sp.]
MRRECLDWLIPIHEGHLRSILREWVTHYNRGRPHASLGPAVPDPWPELNELAAKGHHLPKHMQVVATPILGGLHHEYRLARDAA